jgi:hypothetical protein
MLKILQAIKNDYLPDFHWLEIIELLGYLWVYFWIGIANSFYLFDESYSRFNFFQRKFQSGKIHLSNLHILKIFYVEEIEVSFSFHFLLGTSKRINFSIDSLKLNLNVPTSCVEYWSEPKNKASLPEVIASKKETNSKSIFEKFAAYLLSLHCQLNIVQVQIRVNDEFEFLLSGMQSELSLQAQQIKLDSLQTQIASVQLLALPALITEDNNNNVNGANIGKESIFGIQNVKFTLRTAPLYHITLDIPILQLEVKENQVYLLLDYLIRWKSCSFCSVDYLKDIFDDQLDQLLTQIDQAENDEDETLIKDDFLYYEAITGDARIPPSSLVPMKISVSLGVATVFLQSFPIKGAIDSEKVIFHGLKVESDVEILSTSEEGEHENGDRNHFVSVKLQELLTVKGSDETPLSGNLEGNPIVDITWNQLQKLVPRESNVINSDLKKLIALNDLVGHLTPLNLALSARSVNLLLWASMEISQILQMQTELHFSGSDSLDSLKVDPFVTWNSCNVMLSKISFQLWQSENSVQFPNFSNPKSNLCIQLNEIRCEKTDRKGKAQMQLTLASLIIACKDQFDPLELASGSATPAPGFAGKPFIEIYNVALDMPVDPPSSPMTIDQSLSEFKDFQEWDYHVNLLLSESFSSAPLTPKLLVLVDRCEMNFFPKHFAALSLLSTSLTNHNPLKRTFLTNEFTIMNKSGFYQFNYIQAQIESISLDINCYDEKARILDSYSILDNAKVEYSSLSLEDHHFGVTLWDLTNITVHSPKLQLIYSEIPASVDPSSFSSSLNDLDSPLPNKLSSYSSKKSYHERVLVNVVPLENYSFQYILKSGLSFGYWNESTSLDERNPYGIVSFTHSSHFSLQDVTVALEVKDVQPLIKCINYYPANIFRIPYQHSPELFLFDEKVVFVNEEKVFFHLPTSINHFSILRCRITLLHDQKPLMLLQTANVEYSTVAFGGNLSQVNAECSSVLIAELTGDNVRHKVLLTNLASSSQMISSNSSSPTNKVIFHLTSRKNEYSVMEFIVEYAQIIYLQRGVLTLVMFLRDFFIPDLWNAFIDYQLPNPLPVNNYPKPATHQLHGLTRISAIVRKSELHLPLSSYAPDSLVVIFHHLNFYCTNDYLASNYLSYCLGPYLNKKLWLSEMNNVKQFMQQCYKNYFYNNISEEEMNDPDLVCRWKLFQYFDNELSCDIIQPGDKEFEYFDQNHEFTQDKETPEWFMTVELMDTTITSWCNKNILCNGQDISATIRIRAADPNSEDPVQVIDNENYHTPPEEYRSTIIVDVIAEDIYWVLSQGQYWAIVNLIQQNFYEDYIHIKDPWIAPVWKTVQLNEKIYNKYALRRDLPLINTIPIHIHKGRIICIENDSEFYEHYRIFAFKAETEDILTQKDYHNFEFTFASSIPNEANHFKVREKCFGKWSSKRGSQTGLNSNVSARDREVKIDPDWNAPFCVVFENLELDFFRLHFGGGSGIEVSAMTFMVVTSENDVKPFDDLDNENENNNKNVNNNDEDEVHSQYSVDDSEGRSFPAKRICFGPKDFKNNHPHLSWSEKKSKAPHRNVFASKKLKKQAKEALKLDNPNNTEPKKRIPHIKYSQQGVNNLRRCYIVVENSVVVAHFLTVMSIVDFFHTPIRVNDQRDLRLVEVNGKGRNDWKANLDVEVHIKDSVLGFPNITSEDSSNALCFELNLAYQHGWRGFGESGPGLTIFTIAATIFKTFIAPVNELQSNPRTMFDSVFIQFMNELKCLPESESRERNWNLLKPWMSFSDWKDKENKFHRASGSRYMKLIIERTKEVVEEEEDDEIETKKDEQDALELHEKTLTRSNVTELSPLMGENLLENDEEETDNNGGRDHRNNTTVSRKDKPKQITYGTLSIKDVEFIIAAINFFKESMHQRVLRVPKKDPFEDIAVMLTDIQNMPDLTYYIVHVASPKVYKVDIKEFISDFCDFEFVIRNNTYNLLISKLNLEGIDLSYYRHPQHLHVASQVKASAWAFNDNIDQWEPLIEPIHMNAIAATDMTRSTSGGVGSEAALSTASKIQVTVDTEALEINASQVAIDNLLRKIRLNDVVTTSSQKLPPYKIINELGVDVMFSIGFNGMAIMSKEIKTGVGDCSCPIEVADLTEKLDAFKKRAYYQDGLEKQTSSSSREYLLWVSLTNFRDNYESQVPLSIDRVGITPFQMTIVDEKNETSHFRSTRRPSSIAFTSSKQSGNTNAQPEGLENDQSSLAANPSSSQLSSTGKFLRELPLILLDMRIKEDGVRELRLKSILSFRNSMNRVIHLSVRLYGSSSEATLLPNKEWNIPVRFANPKASLFVRFDTRTPWIEAAPTLSSFILSGFWGDPARLKAEIVSPPAENNEWNENWTILLRPEVKSIKSNRQYVPVRYPTRDSLKKQFHHPKDVNASEIISTEGIEEGSLLPGGLTPVAGVNLKTKASGMIRPLCVHLQPPLQLLNVLPQPLLYRLMDGAGNLFAGGVILPGQIIDIHSLSQLFVQRIFISIRMLNYTWSKWILLFSRANPYSSSEKTIDATLHSLLFYNSRTEKEFHIPPIDVSMIVKEYLVRFSCQLILSNFTDQKLVIADPSNFDLSVPILPNISIRKHVEGNVQTNMVNFTKLHRLKKASTYVDVTAFDDEEIDSAAGDESTGEEIQTQSSDPMNFMDGNIYSPMANNIELPTSKEEAGNIIKIVVYLPSDHFRKMQVIASTSWTLFDLFQRLRAEFSIAASHCFINEFIFFPYKAGKMSKADVQELNNIEDEFNAVLQGELPEIPPIKGKEISLNSIFSSLMKYFILFAEVLSGKPSQKETERPTSSAEPDPPLNMKFDMNVDFQAEALIMTSRLDAIPNLEKTGLVLCHQSEYFIYRQVAELKTITIEREGILLKSFFGKTRYVHRAEFQEIQGDFPFRPHKMLGFNPVVSISVDKMTDWSPGIDFIKSDIDIGEMIIRIIEKDMKEKEATSEKKKESGKDKKSNSMAFVSPQAISPIDHKLFKCFEFGACVEKGRGLFQNSTIVTFVPKHILYSRLPFDIEIRLTEEEEKTSGGMTPFATSSTTASVLLSSNSSANFHFPDSAVDRTLQLRKLENNPPASSTSPSSSLSTLFPSATPLQQSSTVIWVGEFDICILGVFYARLKKPSMILKIETELIGASFITTFSEHNIQWPPYRIHNMTDYSLKFRQIMSQSTEHLSNPSSGKSAPPTGDRRPSTLETTSASSSSLLPIGSSLLMSSGLLDTSKTPGKELEWDIVPPRTASSYCWDYPLTGNKLLQIEVFEGQQNTRGVVSLDDDSKFETLTLVKSVPNIGNPLAADELVISSSDIQSWKETYCIVRPDVIYVYRKIRDQLIKVINLYELPKDRGENALPKFAVVSKYVDKDEGWDIMGTIQSSVGFLGSIINPLGAAGSDKNNKNMNFDVNTVRRMILLTADKMGLLAEITPETFQKGRNDRANSLEDGSIPTIHTPTDLEEVDSPVLDEKHLRMKHRRASLLSKASTHSISQLIRKEEEGDEGGNGKSAEQLPPVEKNSLKSLLTAKVNADELIDEICNQPFTFKDFVTSLLNLQFVENEEKAEDLFFQLYEAEFISEIDPQTKPISILAESEVTSQGAYLTEGNINTMNNTNNSNNNSQGNIANLVNQSFSDMEETSNRSSEMLASPDHDTRLLNELIHYSTDPQDAKGIVSPTSGGQMKPEEEENDLLDMSHKANFLDGSDEIDGMNIVPNENYFDLTEAEGNRPTGESGAGDEGTAARLLSHESVASRDVRPSISEQPFSNFSSRASLFFDRSEILSNISNIPTSAAKKMAAVGRAITNNPIVQPLQHMSLKRNSNIAPSLKDRRKLVIEALKAKDLFFNAPNFIAEMKDETLLQNQFNPNSSSGDGGEIHGVTLLINNQKYHFKCSSYLAFCGWIQGCRYAIEQSFVDFIIKGKKDPPLTTEDFQVNVIMKVRPDGSTKVLEIMEGELPELKINRTFTSSLASLIRGGKNALVVPSVKRKKALQRAAILMPFLSGNQSLMIKSRPMSTKGGITEDGGAGSNEIPSIGDEEQELINVAFHVNSVSLSVIDGTPYEILYLRLDDINMRVLRYVDSVKFTVAVQQIEISNQLLSPSFPVALFPRKDFKDIGKNKKLINLPGYSDMNLGMNTEFPTLYLHMHQRYHKNASSSSSSSSSASSGERNAIRLWYFDIFTLWLAPLQLALEEEFTIRLFRYVNSLRLSLNIEENRKTRKLKEDDSFTFQFSNASERPTAVATGSKESGKDKQDSSAQSALISQGNTKLIGLDHTTAYEIYHSFMDSSKKTYQDFKLYRKSSLHLYFTTLQLHPLDFTLYFRPSPGIQITNAELALLSVINNMDCARLSLNALVAQHAYGSTTLMTEILVKHYRTSFWRQFHRILGGAEPMDNTVGLVANVGGGVYDLSFETMDGLMDISNNVDSSTGKNSEGMSLASRALVGTSAITSKIAGGLGKGVSMLTLDTEFQRVRGYRRYVKANTVSEGIMVGTQELGKNIVEGFTGIVVSPYRGWETGGGVGFGYGVAKGILGVALKPAVGVFDLASRATEGLRATASSHQDKGIVSQLETIHRTRIPRNFGRIGLLLVYNPFKSAAQYIADSLTGFKTEPRMNVVAHLFLKRQIKMNNVHMPFYVQVRQKSMAAFITQSNPMLNQQQTSERKQQIFQDELGALSPTEGWGMKVDSYYLTLVCPDRITLIQISDNEASMASSNKKSKAKLSHASSSSSSGHGKNKNKNLAQRKVHRKLIWSCPANLIEQFGPDSRGDLMLTVHHSIALSGNWFQTNNPVILDLEMQNYYIFQSLLEQTIGIALARQHPIAPMNKGILYGNIKKRYTSGFRSFIMSPTTHVYRLYGNVLYEYTKRSSSSSASAQKSPKGKNKKGGELPLEEQETTSNTMNSNSNSFNPDESNSEEYTEHLISQLFPMDGGVEEERMRRRHSGVSDENNNNPTNTATTVAEENNTHKLKMPAYHAVSPIKEEGDEDDESESLQSEKMELSNSNLEQMADVLLRNRSRNNDHNNDFTASANDGIAAVDGENENENDNENESDGSSSEPLSMGTPRSERTMNSTLKPPSTETSPVSSSPPPPPAPSSTHSSPQKASLSPVRTNSSVSITSTISATTASTTTAPVPSGHQNPSPSSHSRSHSHSHSQPPLSSSPLVENTINEETAAKDYFLSFIYPLIDLKVSGPNIEENGKYFSVTISTIQQPKMRVIKRDDEFEQFIEYHKNGLSLLFSSVDQAMFWKRELEDRLLQSVVEGQPMVTDLVPMGPLKLEDKSQMFNRTSIKASSSGNKSSAYEENGMDSQQQQQHVYGSSHPLPMTSPEDSILNILVIPTSALKPEETETVKVQIFETLSSIKKY